MNIAEEYTKRVELAHLPADAVNAYYRAFVNLVRSAHEWPTFVARQRPLGNNPFFSALMTLSVEQANILNCRRPRGVEALNVTDALFQLCRDCVMSSPELFKKWREVG